MKAVLLLSVLCSVVFCDHVEDTLFQRNAGHDGCLDESEWARFWFHFDVNDDGQVSKMEFDSTWRHEDFDEKEYAPVDFERLDRVADEVLDSQDFPHTFRLFDEDGNGCITHDEFKYNWYAFFDLDD